MASTKVVLPAPFGTIRPTSCPASTARSTSSIACTPPKRTERPLAVSTLLTSGRLRSLALPGLRRAVEGAGDALGVLDQGDDQHDATEQQEPVPGQAEPLVERIRDDALRGDQSGEDGTR